MNALRRFLLQPPAEIHLAATLLRRAVDSHNAGDEQSALDALILADIPAISEWTERVWGKDNGAILKVRTVPHAPPSLPVSQRVANRMPNSAERAALIERDGYHCRFCGIPVVPASIRKRLGELYPEAARWGRTNSSQHSALQAMWMQFDHLLPHARGGDNSLENMAVTCAPCNFGRVNYTLEEVGLYNPLDREPVHSGWNGLMDLA